MRRQLAAQFIRDNFQPTDRLAVVAIEKRTGNVIQRLASAEKIASNEFQAWLRHKNADQHEIYISMNALHENAKGRTKSDVAAIRQVYLDLDGHGTAAVETLLARQDLPKPNYLINSSPDKWQVIWKLEAFTKEQAEHLQRALVAETGADPAATDCSRSSGYAASTTTSTPSRTSWTFNRSPTKRTGPSGSRYSQRRSAFIEANQSLPSIREATERRTVTVRTRLSLRPTSFPPWLPSHGQVQSAIVRGTHREKGSCGANSRVPHEYQS